MKARLLGVDAPEWTNLLGNTHHDFYHLPEYVALCAEQEGGEPAALYVDDAGRAMLLPLVIRKIPGGGRDATAPYGYPGPLVSHPEDADFQQDALTAGVRLLAGEGLVSLFVRLHPLLNAAPPQGIGTLTHHGHTVAVDLALSDDVLWSQTRYDHRRDIRRAVHDGFVARFDDTWTHYETFKRLYGETMRRRVAASYYFFDDAYFEGLRAVLGSRIHLCVVELAGSIAGAALFVETCGIVQWHLAATDIAFVRHHPSKLMTHFVRGWAKERGNRWLHLGGGVGGANDSLMHFKAGFSPVQHPFYTLRVVLDEEAYAQRVSARDPSWDPRELHGYFPQYRRA